MDKAPCITLGAMLYLGGKLRYSRKHFRITANTIFLIIANGSIKASSGIPAYGRKLINNIMKKINREFFVEKGKEGAKKTHRKRYEMIVELSGILDKQTLNKVQNWKTEYIETFLNFARNGKR